MANKAKIGASIVLDGEKKYKEAVTGCNNKLKELRAELGLVKEKYAENANSSEALEEKAKALNARIVCVSAVFNLVVQVFTLFSAFCSVFCPF